MTVLYLGWELEEGTIRQAIISLPSPMNSFNLGIYCMFQSWYLWAST